MHAGVAGLWTERILGEIAVHGVWQSRLVAGARARARCTCAEEGGRKGARCVCILCCISLDWAGSKRRVLQTG